ncbi:hypothetical protein Ae168Ps1_6091c [Pseudonocardia sp. Ae168_Ps1]|nr:hypothetical protein Ae168Ps1_6091c [Pseudonocardia sp. Ae168_Ps1]OLL70767.1 hypothetical protein Ae263Ps1_6181c [Pseudonocardia sp. Ae263_Ps1]
MRRSEPIGVSPVLGNRYVGTGRRASVSWRCGAPPNSTEQHRTALNG